MHTCKSYCEKISGTFLCGHGVCAKYYRNWSTFVEMKKGDVFLDHSVSIIIPQIQYNTTKKAM